MVVRTWRGWTRPEDTDAYAEYILGTGIVECTATPGNQGAYLVSRPDGDRTEFVTISFWDSRESIVAFAGDDIDRAVTSHFRLTHIGTYARPRIACRRSPAVTTRVH